jgi:hypothetical protein
VWVCPQKIDMLNTNMNNKMKIPDITTMKEKTTNHWHTSFANNYKKTTEQANKMTLNNGTGRCTLMDKHN